MNPKCSKEMKLSSLPSLLHTTIFTCTLIKIYVGNLVRISWCGIMSDYCLAKNGVKQGGVLNPVLLCLYIDDMLVTLSEAGVGCFIGCTFIGALAYADDIVLLAPTAHALRQLLAICDDFATQYNICFNAQKSKCMIFPPRRRGISSLQYNIPPFCTGTQPMNLFYPICHLGHVINPQFNDDDDIQKRKMDFNGKSIVSFAFFS
jgi:hypothetical protein